MEPEKINNQVIRVNNTDLSMPSITGQVTVDLNHLDQMRAEHAKAVKVAQDLESHQAEVRIVYYESKTVSDYSTSRHGYDRKDVLTEKSREYKGFDDFRLTISQEEYRKWEKKFRDVEKKFVESEDSKNDYSHALSVRSKELNESKKAHSELSGLHNKIVSERDELTKALEVATEESKARLEIIQSQLLQLQYDSKVIQELRDKKGFWGFLFR